MRARRRIRRIGVVRTATVLALVYAVGGALILIPSALVALLLVPEAQPGAFGSAGFLGSALVSPLLYAFLGWPVTALVLIAYNVVARWLGGIEYEVDEEPMAGEPA